MPWLGAVIAAVAFSLSLSLRVMWVDEQRDQRATSRLSRDLLESPGPEALHLVSFEHRHAWADAMWLATVQQLGSRGNPEGMWDRIERWTWIVVDLDPLYFTVYHSVAVNLTAYALRADASDALLKRGWEHLPERWELPFMLGYNAYYMHGDFEAGAKYMQAAAEGEKAPTWLSALVGRMIFQGGDENRSLAFLESLIEALPQRSQRRKHAAIRLKALRSNLRFERFDAACRRYRDETGELPEDGKKLVSAGYIDEEPKDLFDYPIFFKASSPCAAYTNMITIEQREDRSKKLAGSKGLGGVFRD